jgi:hypothetical protein
VFALGFMNSDIMKNRCGLDHQRVTAFGFVYLFCITKYSKGMVDSLGVGAKYFFHLLNEPVPHNIYLLSSRRSYALFGILTPLCTAKVNLGIRHLLCALSALLLWLILKKLYKLAAFGTLYFEYVAGLPKPLILSGTSDHISILY